MNKQALVSYNILAPCDCFTCLFSHPNSEPIIYRILKSRFRARTLLGTSTIWIGCPRNIDAIPSSFEELFDQATDDEKMTLIYHLNYFRSGE